MLATRTNGRDADGAIVEYDLLEFDHSSQRGVYLIKVGESVVYCGKYSQSFSKRWLYIKKGYIYHFMRDRIAKALNAGDEVVVFAATEDDLRSQIDASCKWINISGIESALIEDLRPAWNRQGA